MRRDDDQLIRGHYLVIRLQSGGDFLVKAADNPNPETNTLPPE